MTMGTSYSEGSWPDAKAITLMMREQGNKKKKFLLGNPFHCLLLLFLHVFQIPSTLLMVHTGVQAEDELFINSPNNRDQ